MNPATGNRQFTALMSPSQEVQVGAQEHSKIVKQFGLVEDPRIVSYVRTIGQKVSQNTERPEVRYQFFVLDTPMVNAFAVPGGYVYVARGLMALANNEAELAAVLAHEVGHITARHSAERYSQSVVTNLGVGLIGALAGTPGAGQAAGFGGELFLKGYSRAQENEADMLGLRYMAQAGYDTQAMVDFLGSLRAHTALDAQINDRQNRMPTYLSTHPETQERIERTAALAGEHQHRNLLEQDTYYSILNGMTYGDSNKQGFIRGQEFIHPDLDFRFAVPAGFRLINRPSEVVAKAKSGALVLFDLASNPEGLEALSYLSQVWMKGEELSGLERIDVNGAKAATGTFIGNVNRQRMTIRLVAIPFGKRIARFQIAIPAGTGNDVMEDLKRTTYSFRSLTAKEKATIKPYRINIVEAGRSHSVQSLAALQPFERYSEERFRVLNGMGPNEGVQAGRKYKIVVR